MQHQLTPVYVFGIESSLLDVAELSADDLRNMRYGGSAHLYSPYEAESIYAVLILRSKMHPVWKQGTVSVISIRQTHIPQIDRSARRHVLHGGAHCDRSGLPGSAQTPSRCLCRAGQSMDLYGGVICAGCVSTF